MAALTPKYQFSPSANGILVDSKETIVTASGFNRWQATITTTAANVTVTITHGTDREWVRTLGLYNAATRAWVNVTPNFTDEKVTTFIIPAAGTYRFIMEY